MKKFIMILMALMISISCIDAKDKVAKKKWFERDSRIEVVNESTVIFRDVIKLEIKTNHPDQITYVYDIDRSRMVKVARGTFKLELSRGNYLIQSNKKITRTVYDVIVES